MGEFKILYRNPSFPPGEWYENSREIYTTLRGCKAAITHLAKIDAHLARSYCVIARVDDIPRQVEPLEMLFRWDVLGVIK